MNESVADKLKAIAENTLKVYDAGRNKELNTFWERYLHNGERSRDWGDATRAFSGRKLRL